MARDLKCLEVSSMSPPISMNPFCEGSIFSSLHLPDHLHLLGFFLMVFVLFFSPWVWTPEEHFGSRVWVFTLVLCILHACRLGWVCPLLPVIFQVTESQVGALSHGFSLQIGTLEGVFFLVLWSRPVGLSKKLMSPSLGHIDISPPSAGQAGLFFPDGLVSH